MENYRVYLLNERGNFSGAREVAAPSDADALRSAAAINHNQGVEIWCGGRKVAMLKPAHVDAVAQPLVRSTASVMLSGRD